MYNLLPQMQKDALLREYRSRLVIVALFLFSLALAMASVLLVPSVLLSSQREESATRRLDALRSRTGRGDEKELEKVLRESKTVLALLRHEAPKTLFHELLMSMVSVKTNHVSLGTFTFTPSEGGKFQADISGVATDRAGLVSFVKALEQTGFFEAVTAPISDFAKDTHIEFSVHATGSL